MKPPTTVQRRAMLLFAISTLIPSASAQAPSTRYTYDVISARIFGAVTAYEPIVVPGTQNLSMYGCSKSVTRMVCQPWMCFSCLLS